MSHAILRPGLRSKHTHKTLFLSLDQEKKRLLSHANLIQFSPPRLLQKGGSSLSLSLPRLSLDFFEMAEKIANGKRGMIARVEEGRISPAGKRGTRKKNVTQRIMREKEGKHVGNVMNSLYLSLADLGRRRRKANICGRKWLPFIRRRAVFDRGKRNDRVP